MKPLKTKLFAASAALMMTAAPFAMADAARDQLAEQVTNGMEQIGIEPATYEYLTVAELNQIKAVLDGDESNGKKAFKIENIIDTKAEASGTDYVMPESSLRRVVDTELVRLGYTDVDVMAVPFEKIVQIKAVLEDDISSSEARTQIDVILEG